MADKRLIKIGPLVRAATVESFKIRKEADGTKRFAMTLSSEYEVDRGWGFSEILSHEPSAVRLDRAKNGAMPLLFNHNSDDPVGMVDEASVSGGKLRVGGSFFSTQRAQDVATMVEGGLRNVSVGYRIHSVENDVDTDTYTVTDWEPYEASIAPVPADPTVGVDRTGLREIPDTEVPIAIRAKPPDKAAPQDSPEARPERASSSLESRNSHRPKEGNSMSNASAGTAGNGKDPATAAGAAAAAAADPPAAGSDGNRGTSVQVERGPTAQQLEEGRIAAINNMCEACDIKDEQMKRQWITSGAPVNDVSDEIMRIVKQRNALQKKAPISEVGLTPGEAQRFSIVKAVLAACDGDWRKASYEAECSREICKRLNKVPDSKRFYVPYEVQRRPIDPAAIASQERALSLQGAAPWQKRADTVGTSAAGGYLVETINLGFIELLRNRAVVYRMGAMQLAGLVGNVNVPKQTAPGTAYWLASETTQITEAEQTFGQMPLSPHTVGAYTEVSRLLLLQSSPGVEGIVNTDLAAVAALAIDSGALQGSGSSGQPTGIKNVSGVGTAASGDMSTIGYAGQLDFQVALANANVTPARGGYAATPTVASKLMQRNRFANTMSPLWDGNLWDANGPLGAAGFPAMSSNQIWASGMVFGDWEKLVIAEWGVLEIEVNPYANFQAGIIGIRAMMTIDVGLRYPAAFCINGANIT